MATEKEREAFGYEGEYHISPGPSAPVMHYPDLDSAGYPGVVLAMDQPQMLPPNPYNLEKGPLTGPWVWILSISACLVCPCVGIFSIITACLARSSDAKHDTENTRYWTKILKVVSYLAIAAALVTIVMVIACLVIAMVIILDDIVKITESVNQISEN